MSMLSKMPVISPAPLSAEECAECQRLIAASSFVVTPPENVSPPPHANRQARQILAAAAAGKNVIGNRGAIEMLALASAARGQAAAPARSASAAGDGADLDALIAENNRLRQLAGRAGPSAPPASSARGNEGSEGSMSVARREELLAMSPAGRTVLRKEKSATA
jgi:hypothetical protein